MPPIDEAPFWFIITEDISENEYDLAEVIDG